MDAPAFEDRLSKLSILLPLCANLKRSGDAERELRWSNLDLLVARLTGRLTSGPLDDPFGFAKGG